MKRFSASVLLSVMLCMLWSVAGAQTPRAIDKIAWLVGGTWTADATKLGGGMQRIETRYEWAPNKAFIRFTTTFVSTRGSLVKYSGNFYSAPDGTITMWYMDTGGAITQGPLSFAGDDWSTQFTASEANGEKIYQVAIIKRSPDLYSWNLAAKNETAWKPMFSLNLT